MITFETFEMSEHTKAKVEKLQAQREELLEAVKDALDAMLIPGVQINTHHWNGLREKLRAAIRLAEEG